MSDPQRFIETDLPGKARSGRPISIRLRLLLLVMAVLLPAVAAALLVILRTYAAEEEATRRHMRDTTRALSMVIDLELSRRATIAQMLSLSNHLRDAPELSPRDLEGFAEQARAAAGQIGGWIELSAGERVLFSTRGEPAPVARREPRLISQPVLQPLQREADDGRLRATLVQPVVRAGRAVLNVGVTLLPEELQAIIDRQNLPEDWTAAILDDRGTVVARHPGGLRYVGRTATPDLLRQVALSPEAAFQARTLDGVSTTGYFRRTDRGWTYVSAIPRGPLESRVPNAVLQVIAGALLLLGVAIAGATWLSRRIVQPIYTLRAAAARMQSGQRVEPQSTGMSECDDVAAALAEASRAAEHTREDLELRVRQAVERTQEAERRVSQNRRVEALGRLTGGVAHDFNNLLGVISNSTHLIQRHEAARQLQLPLAALRRSVEVGSRLTQHLMRFAGRQAVRPRQLELQRYLADVEEVLRLVLGSTIDLHVRVQPDTRAITVDAGELELALINLATNARDAMPEGGRVTIEARNASEAERGELDPRCRYVLIAFSDTGGGVDDSISHRVFEPFFTTKPVGKGTGLGLSQVHGFCAQAGGAALLRRPEGGGASVWLLLPAGIADAGEAVPAQAELPSDALAGRRLLLVEDNEELGEVTAALLESYGGEVVRETDPSQALRRLDAGEAFDLLLSDIVMPGPTDGIELARQVRERWDSLPVVLISGYSDSVARAGDLRVLRKPCTPEVLVRELLDSLT